MRHREEHLVATQVLNDLGTEAALRLSFRGNDPKFVLTADFARTR